MVVCIDAGVPQACSLEPWVASWKCSRLAGRCWRIEGG
jgi:hypothetical protein